jgi:Peptidase family M28
VLFSAHFDSVSTAPGATDDGMSVVALMHMIDFLSKNRPRRTAVFNINNGEESGLHGAQTCAIFIHFLASPIFIPCLNRFLRHPWSNMTSIFLNFEGAGSGGYVLQLSVIHPNFNRHSIPSRPFLFRSTSYDVLKHFRSAPHIHADVISQDAWDRGIIRSDTDYSVYAAPRTRDVSLLSIDDATLNATGHGYQGPGGGMQGADIAFYRSRSRYHTMGDTIRGMGDGGAMRSLWALMELLRFVGNTILNTKTGGSLSDESERAVYFERKLLF